MPLTHAEIDAFPDFALQKVNNGSAESLENCLKMRDEHREYAESIAMRKECVVDSAADRTKPVDQAIADVCRELGLDPQYREQSC